MAAGLGFKDFATGEVLTAADVDGYLMQGVWVFASATARDAAVTSPQEGNFAYLKDTNVTTYYTGSAWANLDTTGMTNPMTTTGDTIYSSSGSTPARLGIGTAGQVLQVNSGATAPEWATPAGGSTFVGCSLTNTAAQSFANNTETAVIFDSEEFDTDGFHSNVTNNTRITIPSGKGGYYNLVGQITFQANSSGSVRTASFFKNGTQIAQMTLNQQGAAANTIILLNKIVSAVATDYFEIKGEQNSGGALNVRDGGIETFFQATLIGA
jgi:hypothetical protein